MAIFSAKLWRRWLLSVGILGALAFGLLLPSGAMAHRGKFNSYGTRGHATTDPVTLALSLAERYWGGQPPCGVPTITSSSTIPVNLELGPEAGAADFLLWAWTPPSGCMIVFNASAAGWYGWNWVTDDRHFQWFCDVMTHEVGHLFGHGDNGQTNPTSIEYPLLGETAANYDSVPACDARVVLWYGWERIEQ